jgi:ABC-type multidrug transport system fused ATPase/permease subunit
MNRFGAGVNAITNMKSWVDVLWTVHSSVHAAQTAAQPFSVVPMDEPLDWQQLRLEDVSFAYPGSKNHTLNAVTLEIDRGGSYAFAGPTGAGKSTLVDIILGLLDPLAGSVLLDGTPLKEIGVRRWQKRIGYVPQAPLISENSLKANVAFGVPERHIDEEKVRACLALTNLTEMVKGLPQGLETPLGDRGHRLSGGQRQCVAIARALYNDPDILVLDEATSALDNLSEQAIRSALLNLHGRVTIISIAHRFSTIESCDRIFLMEAGRLVGEGSYSELIGKSDLFSRLAKPLRHTVTRVVAGA